MADGGIEELYLFPENIDNSIISQAYFDYLKEDDGEREFEEWWNERNLIEIERVFVEEIYV